MTKIPNSNKRYDLKYFTSWYEAREDDREAISKANLDLILKRKKTIKKILDVGCGYGQFLKICESQRLETFGIDVSEIALKKAKLNTRAKLFCLDASKTDWPVSDEVFNVVTAFDLVEHLPSCDLFFSEAARVLKKGGLLFYTTLNGESWTGKLLGKFISDDPTHINKQGPKYWQAKTKKFGFKNIEILGALIYGFPPTTKLRNRLRRRKIPVLTKAVLTSSLPFTTNLFIFAQKRGSI